MSVAVDTNVIVGIIAGNEATAGRAAKLLEEIGAREALLISPVVYAELHAYPGWRSANIDSFLRDTAIVTDWNRPREIWLRAGVTFATYARRRVRSRGGMARRLIADFLIGAHAEATGGLVTADALFFSTNFPTLRLIETTT